jgi:hypothetical protein
MLYLGEQLYALPIPFIALYFVNHDRCMTCLILVL